jgi:hypothetical protein
VDLPRVGDGRIVDVRAIGVVTSLDANRGILVWETIIHLAGGLGRSIFAKGSLSFRGQTVRNSVFVPACVDSDSEKIRPGRSLKKVDHLYGHLSCTKRQIPRVCAPGVEYNVGQNWRPEISEGIECCAGDSYLEIKAASPTAQAPQSPLLALDPERPYCGRAIASRSH